MIFQNHLTNRLLFILIYCFSKDGKPLLILCKSLGQFFGNLANILLTCLFIIGKDSLFHFFRSNNFLDLLEHLCRNGTACILMLRFSDFCYDPVYKRNDRLIDLVCLVNSLYHLFLGNFVRSGFDHDHLLASRSHCQIQIAGFPLFLRRVNDKFTIDHSYLSHSAGTIKRDIRNTGSNRGTNHSNEFRTALRIHTHYHIVQRDVITIILWEQRTHRSIDNTAGKDRILTGLSLSLIETARDFTYRIQFLLIFHTQREKIDPLSGLFGSCSCTQHSSVSVVHECTSICLFAYTIDVNNQGASAQIHFVTLIHDYPPFLPHMRSSIYLRNRGTETTEKKRNFPALFSGLGGTLCSDTTLFLTVNTKQSGAPFWLDRLRFSDTLFSQTEFLDKSTVSFDIFLLKI